MPQAWLRRARFAGRARHAAWPGGVAASPDCRRGARGTFGRSKSCRPQRTAPPRRGPAQVQVAVDAVLHMVAERLPLHAAARPLYALALLGGGGASPMTIMETQEKTSDMFRPKSANSGHELE